MGALADDAQLQENLSIAVSDNLYISTGAGLYLDRLLAQYDITRPGSLGMGDLSFSQMGIQVNAKKLIPGVIATVLNTFFGNEATRAWCQSGLPEPYALQDGADLILQFESGAQQIITFSEDEFEDINQAQAQEVAAAITAQLVSLGLTGFAQPYLDPTTKTNYVRIYGGALGPYSLVQVEGGLAQTIMEFPTLRATLLANNTTVWQITRTTGSTLRFRWYSGPAPLLGNVLVGDNVMIYGDQFVSLGFGGTFQVTAVRPPQVSPSYTAGWFEINDLSVQGIASSQPNMAPPVNSPPTIYSYIVAQAAYNDLKFFLPKKNTPYSNPQYALAWEPSGNLLKIFMPATTAVVQRQLQGAAHLHLLFTSGDLNGSFGSASVDSQMINIVNDYAIRYPQLGQDNLGTGGTLSYSGGPPGGVPIDYVQRSQGFTTVITEIPHGIQGTNQWIPSGSYVVGAQVFYDGLQYQATINNGSGYGGASIPSTGAKWQVTGPGQNLSTVVVAVQVANTPQDDPNEPFLGPYAIDPTVNYDLETQYCQAQQAIQQGTRINGLFCQGLLPNQPGLLWFDLNTDQQEGPVHYSGIQESTGPVVVNVVSVSQSGNQVVVTCETPHGAIVGNNCTLQGNSNALLDGTYRVTEVPSPTTYVAFNPTSQVQSGTGGTSSLQSTGSSCTVLIDPGYTFKSSHPSGCLVNLIAQGQAYQPAPDGSDYSFFVTGTSDGVTYCQQLIEQITAAGINLEIVILYPGDAGLGNAGDSTTVPPLSDIVYCFGPSEVEI